MTLCIFPVLFLVCLLVFFGLCRKVIIKFLKAKVDEGQKGIDLGFVPPSVRIKSLSQLTKDKNCESSKENAYDIVIVGSGVAGTAIAATLGRTQPNYRVLVLERTLGADVDTKRIIGELMQPNGIHQLECLGLQDALEGIDAAIVNGYEIFYGDHRMSLSYPYVHGNLQTGLGFHNYKFVNRLRSIAKEQPNVELRQGTVKSLTKDKHGRVVGVHYSTKDGLKQNISASLVVVADGCFSSLRRTVCDSQDSVQIYGYFLGMVLKNCKLPRSSTANVVLAHPTPILFYPIQENEVRILIDFPKSVPRREELKEYLLNNVLPQLPKSIHSSFTEAVESEEFRVMPNQVLSPSPKRISGVVVIGDCLNMRHPVTGAGMTVALTDINLLRSLLANLDSFSNTQQLDKIISQFYDSRKAPNATLNILASALYQVMDVSNLDLPNAFFSYCGSGGFREKGPMRLISGLSRNENELFFHFFSVAMWGISYTIGKFPTPFRVLRAWRMMKIAVNIIHPLVISESDSFYWRKLCTFAKFIF